MMVQHAHAQGLWIRFYTLDGVTPEQQKKNGWLKTYNFPSLAAIASSTGSFSLPSGDWTMLTVTVTPIGPSKGSTRRELQGKQGALVEEQTRCQGAARGGLVLAD
jgi:hypothetical protein